MALDLKKRTTFDLPSVPRFEVLLFYFKPLLKRVFYFARKGLPESFREKLV